MHDGEFRGHMFYLPNHFTDFRKGYIEVCISVEIWGFVLWVVTPCSVVVGYHRFRGPYCLHLQSSGLWRRV